MDKFIYALKRLIRDETEKERKETNVRLKAIEARIAKLEGGVK